MPTYGGETPLSISIISWPPASSPFRWSYNFCGVYIGGAVAFIPGFIAKRGLLPKLGFLAAAGPSSYWYYCFCSISSLIRSSTFPFWFCFLAPPNYIEKYKVVHIVIINFNTNTFKINRVWVSYQIYVYFDINTQLAENFDMTQKYLQRAFYSFFIYLNLP